MTIITSGLRQRVRRLGRALYWRLPHAWRDPVVTLCWRFAGSLFSGMDQYESWRTGRDKGVREGSGLASHGDATDRQPFDRTAADRLASLARSPEVVGVPHARMGLELLLHRFPAGNFCFRSDSLAMGALPEARALGYAIAGPLCVAFAQWLADKARADGVRRLYFVAREGQFLKQVFDRVTEGLPDLPATEYLVVSRRAVNVPAISTLDDVLAVAAGSYGPGTLEDFLFERFGLTLSGGDLDSLYDRRLWSRGRKVMIRDERTRHVEPLLEALLPLILCQGAVERPGLVASLAQKKLATDGSCALVDIGYSGTIQRRLNSLLGGGVHGYYMATDTRTESLSRTFGVRVQGCFHHRFSHGDDAPEFFRRSFVAEKLLSSDDPQVIRYGLAPDGAAVPEFRLLSQEERNTCPVRAEVRVGALAFMDDVIAISAQSGGDFRFPPGLAMSLFGIWVGCLAPAGEQVLRALVLDDHYSGRGLVA